ncbi:MAG: hypothetical protein HYW47_03245 [Deltaproteobacteria bacterium]|nr:hypothetical protein [Deltaproteobacteria bacterium]
MNESLTAITDFLIVLESSFFCYLIFSTTPKTPNIYLWAFFFLFIALGAFLGSLYHGFSWDNMPLIWKGVNFTLVIAFTLLPLALYSFKEPYLPFWCYYIAVGVLCLALWTVFLGSSQFLHLLIYEVFSLGLCLMLAYHLFSLGFKQLSILFFIGFVVSAIAALLQIFKVRLGSLGHNDVFHIVEMVALLFFFLAWKFTYK